MMNNVERIIKFGKSRKNMKQLLQQYAAYNIWANKRIIERVLHLQAEIIQKDVPSSFPSIFQTILHMLDAGSMWWQRLKLAEHVERPSNNFTGTVEELTTMLIKNSQQWEEWIEHAGENQLVHVFAYQNSKREQFKQPVFEMLVHLFNHQTYHRGQIVTMFNALGVDKIPPTDFIVFSRKK